MRVTSRKLPSTQKVFTRNEKNGKEERVAGQHYWRESDRIGEGDKKPGTAYEVFSKAGLLCLFGRQGLINRCRHK